MSARFEVVHGNPSDEELAVVVSLLSAAATAAPVEHESRPRSNWASPVMRQTPAGSPGAWWRSGLPRP
jgi:hypothetical protein